MQPPRSFASSPTGHLHPRASRWRRAIASTTPDYRQSQPSSRRLDWRSGGDTVQTRSDIFERHTSRAIRSLGHRLGGIFDQRWTRSQLRLRYRRWGVPPDTALVEASGRRVVARALPDDERSSSASRRPLSLHCPDLGRRSDGPPAEAPATPGVEAPPPGAEGGWVLPARNVNGFGFSAVGRKGRG